MKQILALLLAGVLLLLSQCGGKKEHLYTEKQVLRQLEETYGEEFAILRRQELSDTHMDNRYIRQGVIYTAAPLENTELTFEVRDLVGVATGSPVPNPFPDEFHVFWVYYIDTVLAGELEALCEREGIRRLDEEWFRLELSEERWEDQAEALAEFFAGCSGRRPYSCGRPMSSWLSLRVGGEEGNRWGGGFYDSGSGTYGLDLEEILEELGRDPEAPAPAPEEPELEVHYGDQIILDGDEVIVVDLSPEPEETTVPFGAETEEGEIDLGQAALG